MIQWYTNGGSNQRWNFVSNGAGAYTIQNASSGLYLADVSANPGTSLEQNTATGDATELWRLMLRGSGFTIQNQATGMVMDDSNFNLNPGPSIILYPANGGVNQSWRIQ